LARTSTSRLARLNADGSLDKDFANALGSGFDRRVKALAAVPGTGDVYVGGDFAHFNGREENRLMRLHPDGSPEAGFKVGDGFDGPIESLVATGDDLLVAGSFGHYQGVAVPPVVRLKANGSLDTTFTAPDSLGGNALSLSVEKEKNDVKALFAAGDGWVARLHPDGTLDRRFDVVPGTALVQATNDGTGGVYVGGSRGLTRLRSDGSADPSFQANPRGAVRALLLETTGLLVGGERGVGRLSLRGISDPRFHAPSTSGVMALAEWQGDDEALQLGLGGSFSGSFLKVPRTSDQADLR